MRKRQRETEDKLDSIGWYDYSDRSPEVEDDEQDT